MNTQILWESLQEDTEPAKSQATSLYQPRKIDVVTSDEGESDGGESRKKKKVILKCNGSRYPTDLIWNPEDIEVPRVIILPYRSQSPDPLPAVQLRRTLYRDLKRQERDCRQSISWDEDDIRLRMSRRERDDKEMVHFLIRQGKRRFHEFMVDERRKSRRRLLVHGNTPSDPIVVESSTEY